MSTRSFAPAKDPHFEKVLEDKDHKRVSHGNQASLLHERLENLRALKYEILQDDWKYQKGSEKPTKF
jgi:hypothetical protein